MGTDDIQAMRARLARAERRLRITSMSWLVIAIVIAVLWMLLSFASPYFHCVDPMTEKKTVRSLKIDHYFGLLPGISWG